MRYHVTLGGRSYEVTIENGAVLLEGEPVEASLAALSGTQVRALRVGHAFRRLVVAGGTRECWSLQADGYTAEVEAVDERTLRLRELSGAGDAATRVASVRAPMPGLVVKVEVEEGQQVTRGQGTVIVEAMKMENELTAEADARVARVLVSPGETVEKGQILVELEPADAS